LAIVCVAVGFWSLTFTQLFVAMPRRMHYPTLIPLAVLLVVVFEFMNDDHLLRVCQKLSGPTCTHGLTAPPRATQPPRTLEDQLKAWVPRACPHPTTNSKCPIIFVAAAGGGLRAAYWTAGTLGRINDATSGHFYPHLFAISSVSGGSLGSAAFILANEDNRPGPRYDAARTQGL
jgi:hypothetical protein